MEFVLPLSLIVVLGIALAWWLVQRRAFEFAAQHKQDALFDKTFRPVAKPAHVVRTAQVAHTPPQGKTHAQAAPLVQAVSTSAKVHPVTTPLRELALVMYESQGFKRIHARADEAPVQFWLRQPGEQHAYAMLEVECAQPLSESHLNALIKRLPETQERIVVLSKEGFTREAKSAGKRINIKLIDSKSIKRKLAELPPVEQEQLMLQVKRNLRATSH
jgi:hypothetical protein